MTDTIENGVFLRDGKPAFTLPGDNDRAVAAFKRNQAAADEAAQLLAAEQAAGKLSPEAQAALLAELEGKHPQQ